MPGGCGCDPIVGHPSQPRELPDSLLRALQGWWDTPGLEGAADHRMSPVVQAPPPSELSGSFSSWEPGETTGAGTAETGGREPTPEAPREAASEAGTAARGSSLAQPLLGLTDLTQGLPSRDFVSSFAEAYLLGARR